jgi:hemerythrin-like metal-binding protein
MQAPFEWNQYFETGLAEVDQQHRHLVNLINRLGSEVEGASAENVDRTLDELARYTVYHFSCEEKLMAEHVLAEEHQQAHRRTHQRFVAQVQDWMATREQAGQLSAVQLIDYLANWLVFHILGDDQAMGRQIKAIRAGVPAREAYGSDRVADDPRTDILLRSLRKLYGGLLQRNEELLTTYRKLQTEHGELEAARNELADLNADLEQRVADRTRDLEQAGLRLRQEQERTMRAEKMAAVGLLAAGFAHEINTPVGIAVGSLSQFRDSLACIRHMLSGDEVSEEAMLAEVAVLDEAAELALANLDRAARLVQAFKRSSIDQAAEQVEEFSLREVIEDDLLTLRSQLKRLPVEVNVDCAADTRLSGVRGLYHQLFTNLILNALQHGLVDGFGHSLRIGARRAGDRVAIEVEDDGRGMAVDVITHVFEPFFTTRRGSGGTGLGLYICYDIVTNRLGGTIRCDSAPGHGCRFRIDVPASPPAAATQPAVVSPDKLR